MVALFLSAFLLFFNLSQVNSILIIITSLEAYQQDYKTLQI